MRKTVAVLGLLLTFILHGDTAPELVRDFRKSAEPVDSQPQAFFSNGEVAYFFADDGNGHELWTSDGTAEGTHLVAELTAGRQPEYLVFEPGFVASGDLVYFWHRDYYSGATELWRTDGTHSGTFAVTRELEGADNWYYPLQVAPIGERGALIADYATFVTDGTVEGTRFLEIEQTVQHPVALNGLVYFVTYSSLWRTDGTEAGTREIINVDQELGYDAQTLVHGGAIYILARNFDDYDTFDIVRSDGTAAGTSRVASVTRDPDTGARPTLVAIEAGVFVLVPREETTHVMRIDTSGATLAAVVPTVFDDDGFTAASDTFFVFGTSNQGLWRSDGTAGGTRRIEGASSYLGSVAITSSHVLFLGADGVYAHNGTSAERITTNEPDSYLQAAMVGDRFVLELRDQEHGSELWISDGTESGTRLLKNIHPDNHSGGSLARRFGEMIVFRAHSDENGLEPWVVDHEGLRVIDIEPGEFSSSPNLFTEVNGFLLFVTEEGYPFALRSTDGSALHTLVFANFYPDGNEAAEFPVVGDRAFVFGHGNGDEVWTSDGTLENTMRGTSLPYFDDDFDPVAAAGVAFFVSDGALWRTDATLEGTFAVASDVLQLHAAGEHVFFIAQGSAHGNELWVSDGTLAGTHIVKDIHPGREDAFFGDDYGFPVVFQTMGNSVIFAADDGQHGVEPWRSDGTEAGTVLLRDVAPGLASSMLPKFDPEVTAVAGGFAYFVADDGVHGRELWRTDGTDRTELVHDIARGQASSTPTGMRGIGERVYFSADDGKHGRELWWSSLAGTGLVADIAIGSDSSLPHDITELDGWLYFFAMTEATGDELWRIEAPKVKRRALR